MPSKKPERQFKMGDRVIVSLAGGQIVEASVRVVVNRADGVRLQVDYGHDETALVELWQVRTEEC
jgi:hypothetical protein